MKILIAIPRAVLPVTTYGGTERVVWYLGHELSRLGHDVYFLAADGTKCDFASVITFDPSKTIEQHIPAGIDIVHFQGAVPKGFPFPHVVTIHGNKAMDDMSLNSIFVSGDHAHRFGSESFVYNGLDWDDYGPVEFDSPRGYYHFLGKAAWRVKNVRGAISVINDIPGGRLEVLGGYRFNFKMGMRFTFSPKVHFHGMVGGEEKLIWLKGSRGLVFPVTWNEPFGLAITESLYCGAPVFGTPYGSLPELVAPEVGFLTDSHSTMVDHLLHGYNYSPRLCHEYARDKFNSKVMAMEYLKKYEKVLNGETLNTASPCALPQTKPTVWNK